MILICMHDRNGVRLSLIHSLPSVAEARGVSAGDVMAMGGLAPDAFRDFDKVVRRSQIHAIMQGLARRSGDAQIGLTMAEASSPDMLGLFGRALVVGRTLRESLALQQRQMPWLQSGTSISMATIGPWVQWTHRMHGSDPGEARFLNEGIAAFFVKSLRVMSGDHAARLHVILPHRPMAPVSRYEEAMGCAVSFVPGSDLVIRFDASLLERRNRLCGDGGAEPEPAGPVALPAACELSDERLLESLLRMFEMAALMGRLTLRDTARTLGFSPRTLQRRLAGFDTSFEEVVDQWRRRQALDMLAGPCGGTAEVAARLGYTDASHFIRAFRRWQGVSPTDFRRARAQDASESGV